MRLEQALGVKPGDVISFIGAGGKTSALFRLGQELAASGLRVLATTTTRVSVHEVERAPAAVAVESPQQVGQVLKMLNQHRFVFLYHEIRGEKVIGVSPEFIQYLLDRVSSDVLLVEADGSRRLPFKAPYPHEPVVPFAVTHVVLVAGMSVLGQPLDDAHVYNPEAMIHRYGYPDGGTVVWPWVASVLRDEQLGLYNVPLGTPVTVLLNQAEREGIIRRRARLIASLLLRSPRIGAVAVGDLNDAEAPIFEVRRPVAAVLLAGGMSSRMGKLKVLLPWGKETVLETIIRRLHMARVDDVVVVTGHRADEVAAVAQRLGVRSVHNPDYARGEMLSSLQAGIQALDDRFSALLTVLGDQPRIQGRVVSDVLTAYAEGQGSIIAPSFQMRRGHPILIDRKHWAELLALGSGSSPRDVINKYAAQIGYVNVNTDSILMDIDTPEDYREALRREGLL